MDLLARVLAVANGEIGTREKGANWGARVSQYLAATNIGFPAAWCGAFCWWCVARVGGAAVQAFEGITPRNFAYTPFILAWAKREGLVRSKPKAGDLFLCVRANGSAFHVGFVAGVVGDSFRTIEGNSNDEGSNEGVEVCSNLRASSGRYVFVRWAELLQDVAAPASYRKVHLAGRFLWDCPVVDGRTMVPVRKWLHKLGFTDEQIRYQDGAVSVLDQELDLDLVVLNGAAAAPVRQLAAEAGLQVKTDAAGVWVSR